MLLMGNALFELGDFENSSLYFEKCLRINPNYSFALNNLEHVADNASKNGDLSLSVKCYEKLLVYQNNDIGVLLKLGQLYGRDLRNNELALKYILQASSIAPTNVDVLSKLGIVYSMMGNSSLAIDTFNRVLVLDEENANALFNLGITYLNLGKKEEGEKLIQRAIELDPSLNR
jgi:tetratricopeptide (TPR) repeat protein